ncbi:MAG: class I tRNA ligase family protein [Patescibacteria group bacterium]
MAGKEDNNKSEVALREERVLEFWQENNTFQKTLEKDSPKGEFVFYEGPPTANGKPGIHHLEARAFKDAIPRYKTMRGYHVRRKGGWDTHGLPVELQVEKKLELNSKKAIEEYGIAEFNKQCKESVWEYLDIWNKFTKRIGYWVDQENPYVTYHNDYIESVWNVLAQVEDRKLLYKDYKVVPWCPRCGTALSSHELAQGYQDDKDLSVTAKFKIKGVVDGYFLAWTTTPWTLAGNVALAVGSEIIYVEAKVGPEVLVLAKDRLSIITDPYEIVAEHKGSEMVGMEYEPLYPYLSTLDVGDEKLKNAYKVYPADFVNTTDGTGIVHTAVMYGQDDFELGTKIGLPKFHTVDDSGHFVKGTGFLEGRFVKDEEVAVDIIKDLAHRGLLFKKEKYEHSYPHCWRCKTALIYYARDSWYIRMSDPSVKDKLIAENKEINWEPPHIRDGRFGEWLKDIKDWAISRERYWGTPLPIWQKADGSNIVVDSIDTLKKYIKKSGNSYFIMRHGGTEGNLEELVSYKHQETDNLTENGKEQVRVSADKLKDHNIDIVIYSPFTRTTETATIVKEVLGLGSEQVMPDARLIEINPGIYDGKNWSEYHEHLYNMERGWFVRKIPEGESLQDVTERSGAVLYDLEAKYSGKNILIITHGGPAWAMYVASGIYEKRNTEYKKADTHVFVKEFKQFGNAEVRELPFVPLPHDKHNILDLHKPYIDEVELFDEESRPMTRVKEVMDVWFDSGAMPFAQDHYPFENKEWVDTKGFPADYICEAIDQTRGWFYTLHAIGVLTGRGKAFKNVICLGHILDKDGKKMSKSVGNVVDPWEMMDKYGVDTLRLWMYSVNQPGESKNFDEKTVSELNNKVFNLFYNVLAFYELYRDKSIEDREYKKSDNILDQWIIARLNKLVLDMTNSMDNYKLLEPVRGIREFVDELSTWYVRRSRERIKDGDVDVKQTLYFVLKTFSKILAPFAPFAAEDIWQKLKNTSDAESVHLAEWPEGGKVNEDLISEMQIVRHVVTLGLEARQKANIKVRQPLSELKVKSYQLKDEYIEIIKDELNIKAVVYDDSIENPVELDSHITLDLKKEGQYRELVRAIQDMRKKEGLNPNDVIVLTIATNTEGQEIVNKWKSELMKIAGAKEVNIADNQGTEVKIDELTFLVSFS